MKNRFVHCRVALATAGLLVASSTSILAMGDPANTCEAAKLREAGKLASCVLGSLAKSTKSGDEPDASAAAACEEKFTGKLSSAEGKSGGACPTDGDAAALAEQVSALAGRLGDAVSGERFHDNGDGTVRDSQLGVVWQQQVAGTGSASSVDDVRSIDDALVWLGTLNGNAAVLGLGGHSDWGLPTLAQVQSILDCTELPCGFVDPVLGPDPTPAVGGSTYILTGETSTLPLSTVPCFKRVRLEDGSVSCVDGPSANGSSRARIMNNAR